MNNLSRTEQMIAVLTEVLRISKSNLLRNADSITGLDRIDTLIETVLKGESKCATCGDSGVGEWITDRDGEWMPNPLVVPECGCPVDWDRMPTDDDDLTI